MAGDNSMQVTFYAGRIKAGVDKNMPRLMAMLGTLYANEVKELMRSSPATGRVYRRGKVEHRASAPGEPPAPDRGDLLRSIMWRVWNTENAWFVGVGSRLKKALYLEFGAAGGVKNKTGKIVAASWILFPRPAWGPAMANIRDKVKDLVRGEIRK